MAADRTDFPPASDIAVADQDGYRKRFLHDRVMSLHRRAYRVAAEGGTFSDWAALAAQLDLDITLHVPFWRTARAAREAGMTAEKDFPLTGEMENPIIS